MTRRVSFTIKQQVKAGSFKVRCPLCGTTVYPNHTHNCTRRV